MLALGCQVIQFGDLLALLQTNERSSSRRRLLNFKGGDALEREALLFNKSARCCYQNGCLIGEKKSLHAVISNHFYGLQDTPGFKHLPDSYKVNIVSLYWCITATMKHPGM